MSVGGGEREGGGRERKKDQEGVAAVGEGGVCRWLGVSRWMTDR